MKCAICENEIDSQNEKYAEIVDYSCEKVTGNCFIHHLCWEKKFAIVKEIELRKLMGAVLNVKKMYKKEGVEITI